MYYGRIIQSFTNIINIFIHLKQIVIVTSSYILCDWRVETVVVS